MDKRQLVQLIRDCADILKPLLGKLQPVPEGEKSERAFIEPGPYALAWSSSLYEMAEMLECQDGDVSEKQMHHIKHSLGVYGGNTTLDDLWFSSTAYAEESKGVNEALKERIKFLRAIFGEGPQHFEPWGAAVRDKNEAGSQTKEK